MASRKFVPSHTSFDYAYMDSCADKSDSIFRSSSLDKPDPIFRSSSPGPGEIHNMRIHAGMLVSPAEKGEEQMKPACSSFAVSGPKTQSMHLQSQNKICSNLRYNLEQLRLSSDRKTYTKIVDSVVVGPANIKADEIEHILGINIEIFTMSKNKRNDVIYKGSKPNWTETKETVPGYISTDGPRGRPHRVHSLPTISRNHTYHIYGKRKATTEYRDTKRNPSVASSSDLHHMFELFSRFGGSPGEGTLITLSQTDRWLRQAKVIDSWNVTTTDTALAFRKISRGSIWLDFLAWREFLSEFSSRTGLDIQDVVDKLENCGKPSLTESTRLAASFNF